MIAERREATKNNDEKKY